MSEYKDSPTLSVIVPCFNEAETIPVLIDILTPVLDRIDGGACEVVAIDDGSRDETFQRLSEWRESDHRVRVVRLSRNFGKEAALSCGLHFAAGRAAVILDADLQDPPRCCRRWSRNGARAPMSCSLAGLNVMARGGSSE